MLQEEEQKEDRKVQNLDYPTSGGGSHTWEKQDPEGIQSAECKSLLATATWWGPSQVA